MAWVDIGEQQANSWYPGRRIISLQTSLALISSPGSGTLEAAQPDPYRREPFRHPALDGLSGLTHDTKDSVLSKQRLSNLAKRYGLDGVTRWKPKQVRYAPESSQGPYIRSALN